MLFLAVIRLVIGIFLAVDFQGLLFSSQIMASYFGKERDLPIFEIARNFLVYFHAYHHLPGLQSAIPLRYLQRESENYYHDIISSVTF